MSAYSLTTVLPIAATLLTFESSETRGAYLEADRKNRRAIGWDSCTVDDLHEDALAVVAFVLAVKERR